MKCISCNKPAEYRGITHIVPTFLLLLWKRLLCSKDIHCFDECLSTDSHVLVCDACDLEVEIKSITPYEENDKR